jgi:hypothetical protein
VRAKRRYAPLNPNKITTKIGPQNYFFRFRAVEKPAAGQVFHRPDMPYAKIGNLKADKSRRVA